MIAHRTSEELEGIALQGASMVVDGTGYTAAQLAGIASRLQPGATLHVANSSEFTAKQMGDIASKAHGSAAHAMFS